jgi:hypothetical protein
MRSRTRDDEDFGRESWLIRPRIDGRNRFGCGIPLLCFQTVISVFQSFGVRLIPESIPHFIPVFWASGMVLNVEAGEALGLPFSMASMSARARARAA